ncbi:MAG TPA: VWA domain-containing protein [Spirochaetia bacterium]
MSFTWPGMLWLLLLVPVAVGAWVWLVRRQDLRARRGGALLEARDARGRGPGFRRHVPVILFIAGVAVAVVALSRPTATVATLAHRGTVILSLDISGSMRARDIFPSRMEAVKDSARSFVDAQPSGVRLGIVAFSGTSILVQPPTTDKAMVLAAIDALRPQMFTAIGSGLEEALSAIFPKPAAESTGASADSPLVPAPAEQAPPPVAPGSFTSAAIILLSDGQSNQGPDPLDVAQQAADRGVRVFTIGVGTREGADLSFGRFTFHATLDEATLKRIAQITGGTYSKATSSEELHGIYRSLGTRLLREKESTEITAIFTAVALALFLLSSMLSMIWFRRVL